MEDEILSGLKRAKAFYCTNDEVRPALEWAIAQRIAPPPQQAPSVSLSQSLFPRYLLWNMSPKEKGSILANLLMGAFNWSSSSRGDAYWRQIHSEFERMRYEDKL